MEALRRSVGPVLTVVHAVVGGWALVGIAELVDPAPPWPPISNPVLPASVLLVHWTLMLLTAGTFLAGYALRWRHTPVAVAVCYAALAALCAVETAGFLRAPRWYASMAVEYAAYGAILLLLFKTSARRRFTGRPAIAVHLTDRSPE